MENENKNPECSNDEREALVMSKREFFVSAGPGGATEFDEFNPCRKCKFLGANCHNTCGVILKHEARA